MKFPAIGAEALFFRPDDIADFPGVVFLTDIWGIRPANIGVAKRLAERGFAVLMPNVFHRYSRMTPDGFEHGSRGRKDEGAACAVRGADGRRRWRMTARPMWISCWRRRA